MDFKIKSERYTQAEASYQYVNRENYMRMKQNLFWLVFFFCTVCSLWCLPFVVCKLNIHNNICKNRIWTLFFFFPYLPEKIFEEKQNGNFYQYLFRKHSLCGSIFLKVEQMIQERSFKDMMLVWREQWNKK